MSNTPNVNAPEVTQSQLAYATINEANAIFDAFISSGVINSTTNSPPGSPANYDFYRVGSSGSSDWTGYSLGFAMYLNGAWKKTTAKEGMQYWDKSTNKRYRYDGSAWVEVSLRQEQTMGITLKNPTAAEDIGFFFTKRAITVTQATAVVKGTSPSVTYQVKHDTSRAGAGNNLFSAGQTITSTTTGTTSTTFSDATIPANSWVWLTTSASSGPTTDFQLMLLWTED